MRLLNTSTLGFVESIDENVPDYAILSHRWGNEEVTYADMRDGTAVNKAGYSKLVNCCKQAFNDGWKLVWIDSCCIDKSSSAELSEAINSMFKWYASSQVCYAYLSDVPSDSGISSFRQSKWFTRGWTLQELLAPDIVVFLDQEWQEIGTKSTLRTLLSEITGISSFVDFRTHSVAQKMSWASKRVTTRVEDIAYCLMGLFDVHMPIIYGEGEAAFLRLQLEILKTREDETIFAWNAPYSDYRFDISESGLLSPSPHYFEDCHTTYRMYYDSKFLLASELEAPPVGMTSRGLYLTMRVIPAKYYTKTCSIRNTPGVVVNFNESSKSVLVPLRATAARTQTCLCIVLKPYTFPHQDEQSKPRYYCYRRVATGSLLVLDCRSLESIIERHSLENRTPIYVNQQSSPLTALKQQSFLCTFNLLQLVKSNIHVIAQWSSLARQVPSSSPEVRMLFMNLDGFVAITFSQINQSLVSHRPGDIINDYQDSFTVALAQRDGQARIGIFATGDSVVTRKKVMSKARSDFKEDREPAFHWRSTKLSLPDGEMVRAVLNRRTAVGGEVGYFVDLDIVDVSAVGNIGVAAE